MKIKWSFSKRKNEYCQKKVGDIYLQEWENHCRKPPDYDNPQKREGGFFTLSGDALNTFLELQSHGLHFKGFHGEPSAMRAYLFMTLEVVLRGSGVEAVLEKGKNEKTGRFIISNFWITFR